MVTVSTWPASTQETNSLKGTSTGLRWKFDEKFQTTTPTTTTTSQNTRLFKVEFNIASKAPLAPQCQDYHGGRIACDSKRLTHDVPGHPGNSPVLVGHDRHERALVARHVTIHEHILQFLV